MKIWEWKQGSCHQEMDILGLGLGIFDKFEIPSHYIINIIVITSTIYFRHYFCSNHMVSFPFIVTPLFRLS